MLQNVLPALMKVGLISNEMVKPRALKGVAQVTVSIVAVAFSYFYFHISFFGPPRSEIFKGVYILATSILCLLIYK